VPLSFKIEYFEGPLDLLLQLVEQEELDISTLSLAAVADQFVQHVNNRPDLPLEELADFLVVAAKLIYLKSKLLLPSLYDQELEDGPDMETQLRTYREFVRASRIIDRLWRSNVRSFVRVRRPVKFTNVVFSPPSGITTIILRETMMRVIVYLEPRITLPKAAVERVVTIQEKITQLFAHIQKTARITFSQFLGNRASKPETVASFLALLELVKQRFVHVSQESLFHEISIKAHPDPPAADPFVESYV